MIESHVCPAGSAMTGTTIGAELTVVLVLRRMACITICRSTLINAIYVTGATLNIGMFAGKREIGVAVIEVDIRPFGGFMATSTIRAKLTAVLIPRGVTGITILRRPFVHIVQVTRFTGNSCM